MTNDRQFEPLDKKMISKFETMSRMNFLKVMLRLAKNSFQYYMVYGITIMKGGYCYGR